MADATALFDLSPTGARAKIFASDPIASVDAPEPTNAVGTFVYNFFTRNERSEYAGGSGFVSRQILGDKSTTPRYVEISFKKPTAVQEIVTGLQAASLLGGRSLLELASQNFLHIEDSVTSEKFQRVQVTAAGIDLRTVSAISGSSSYVTDDAGSSRSSNPELSRKISQSIAGVRGELPEDLATQAAVLSSDSEISEAIINYINKSGQAAQRISYYEGETRQSIEAKADIISDRQETLGINRIVFDSVVRASSCNINHLLNPEINAYRASSELTQRQARESSAAAGISASTYSVSVVPFYTRAAETPTFKSVLVGYAIEKLELKNGEFIEHPTVIVDGASVTTVRDSGVNYGSMYKFRVRAIFARETAAVFSASGRSGVARFLVASSGESAEVFVPCVEEVPPPEPADFRLSYDYELSSFRLTWSLPVNPQRDIKYFQIFRRESIGTPFRLIRVIDFDDSTIREEPRETYPSSIVTRAAIVQSFYLDAVPAEKEFIYAVCSVDAHGLSSGYSMQIGGIFKRSKNALLSRIVSREGAPKTYPNLYVNEDAFSDVVRDAGSKKIVTFLDPEALRIIHPSGQAEDIVEDCTFTISLINEDNCLSDNIVLETAKYAANDLYLSSSITATPREAVAEDPSPSSSNFAVSPFR